jgi:hypothetical protein
MAVRCLVGLFCFHEQQEIFPQSRQGWLPVRREPLSHVERNIMLGTILVVLLVLMLIGSFPAWPHSRNWGYYPSSGLGALLVVLVVLLLLGRI